MSRSHIRRRQAVKLDDAAAVGPLLFPAFGLGADNENAFTGERPLLGARVWFIVPACGKPLRQNVLAAGISFGQSHQAEPVSNTPRL